MLVRHNALLQNTPNDNKTENKHFISSWIAFLNNLKAVHFTLKWLKVFLKTPSE